METQKLQIPQNSKILLKQLETQARGYNLKPSLAIAMERLDMEFKNIDNTINDICTEFGYIKLSNIKDAIRKGGLGQYGRSYRLSTQEVCYWIREYLKENKNKLGI